MVLQDGEWGICDSLQWCLQSGDSGACRMEISVFAEWSLRVFWRNEGAKRKFKENQSPTRNSHLNAIEVAETVSTKVGCC